MIFDTTTQNTNYVTRAISVTLMLCILSADIAANDLFKFGTPFIQHFTKKDYRAGNQNWSITQDRNGFIYVGNSNGVLQFDGNRWAKFNLPTGALVRSVYADKDRIYCGSLGDLGYWEVDSNFSLKYTSLTGLLKDYKFGDEEIWWITRYKNDIIFQSFSTTFLYDGKSIEIILSKKGVIFPPFVVNDRLFIQVLNAGLFEVKNGEASFIPGSEVFIEKRVNSMLPFSSSSDILIATEDDGCFTYSGDQFVVWPTRGNNNLMKDQINRGIKISDKTFAFGTLLGGIYIVNEEGLVVNQINKEKGLNNNTVLSLFLDKKNNLWVGLDNGVDLLKVNSPIYYYTDVSGNIGSVYTSAIFEGDLYLGTNRGVFYTGISPTASTSNENFKIIPGSQGQVWDLSVIDGKLFCGHNTSTYIIDNYQLRKVSNVSGGYKMKTYPYNDHYLVQGSYNGLSVYDKVNDTWEFSHTIPGFQKLSKTIEFERENVLWVSHTHRGLYRLELNSDLTEISEVREFSPNLKTYVNKLNKKIVLSSDSGFLYYDDIQNTFFPLEDINKSLGKFAVNSHIIPTGNDIYWVFKEGACARVIMDESSVAEIDDDVLNDLSEFLIPGYEDVYVIDSAYTLIYLDNGYAIYDNSWEDSSPNGESAIFVREFSFNTLLGKTYEDTSRHEGIPYRYNNVKLLVSYPEFARDTDLMYRLEGYNERWINAGKSGEISFQNLPDGDYTIQVVPENASADGLSISFTINPPWFRSATARFLYFLIVLVVLGLSVILNRRKINRIHRQHELDRRQLLEKEAEENEKKLIKLRNENLRNEIKLRNSRLAKSTFSLIHKNNTLIAVKEELTKIKEELGVRFPSKYFNRLIKNIDSDLTSEHDWRMFEQSFSEVHENFLHKLKAQYPDLTPADIQLCAYLKMNLSSKEIATLLNITIRGVEIRRYRLRKKLHLEHDTNLVEYIMGY